MAKPLTELLNAEKALIFRITHRANVPWILQNGIHCRCSTVVDPEFISIGNPELIEKRRNRTVPIAPAGTLENYVPFYFTPKSPMLYNIRTGYGITKRPNEDIVILVSSLPAMKQHGVDYVFTDRHASLQTASFFCDEGDLDKAVDFPLLQSADFTRDAEHPGRFERYQAEALAYDFVPTGALLGLACYTSIIKHDLDVTRSGPGADVKIVVRADWYF